MADTEYRMIDNGDPYVKEVEDVATGQRYFAKEALDSREIDDLRAASLLEFPEELGGILSIPKLVSEGADGLPQECTAWNPELVIVAEAAQGRELLSMERPRDGGPKVQIHEGDWRAFCEAVSYMNAQGIVHGDIQNTSNIYVQQDEHGNTTFELIDWGGKHAGKDENDLADLVKVEESYRRDGLLIPDPTPAPQSALGHTFCAQLGVNVTLSGDTALGRPTAADGELSKSSPNSWRPS